MPEILLIPDGHTKCRDGREFDFDQESWSLVEKAFRSGGVDLVVDYEHQTAGGVNSSPDGKAPAAGWIKDLRYEMGRGLVGMVEWTASATDLIRQKEYRYLSPYMMVHKETRKVTELLHAAITNNPAIAGMEEIAAKGRREGFVLLAAKAVDLGVEDMAEPKDKTEPAKTVALATERLTALVAAMKAQGFANGDETPDALIDKLVAALAGLKKSEPIPLTAIAAKLGVKGEASESAILTALDAMRTDTVPASEYKAVAARLETLELAAKASEAHQLVASAIEAAKVNPNNQKQLAWARDYAKSDAAGFKKWADAAPELYHAGRLVTPDAKLDGKGDQRSKAIAEAKEEFAANRAALPGIQLGAYVNSALSLAGETLLTADEKKAL